MIAWFGAGLLGANFVTALRRKGEEVRVWNRTSAKAKALEAVGAHAVEDAPEAARGADRIHVVLSDDAAVDAVLERLRPGLAAGAVIIDHTTTSLEGAATRARVWAERGVPYMHAPVFMGPQHALESSGYMMISGDEALRARVTPLITPMTGKVIDLGPDPTRAALFKLMGNLFILAIGGGLADMLALAKANGVSAAEAGTLFEWFKVGNSIDARVQRMLEADYGNPSWELAMARKDARLMQDAMRGADGLAILPGMAAVMDAWIARGHAHDDWLVIGKDAVKPGA